MKRCHFSMKTCMALNELSEKMFDVCSIKTHYLLIKSYMIYYIRLTAVFYGED